MRFGKPMAVTFLLLFETAKRMFKPGDGAKRRDRDGQIGLKLCARALKQGLIVVAILEICERL